MRFVEGGPDIPDKLLQERDEGRVVFLCGAGVSQTAGLPSFVELATLVSEELRVPQESEILTALGLHSTASTTSPIPLDDIFFRLQNQYGRGQVDASITEVLSRYKEESVRAHKIVGRISSDQLGNPQIVTTNFDKLFDCVLRGKEDVPDPYVPPMLPRIDAGTPITGVTHLHGRLIDGIPKTTNYIISSADLGLAYLVEGWATEFVRSLLDLYTVVFVGYRAEDPPIKYLLRGLDSRRSGQPGITYAFECGAPEAMKDKWGSMGIVPIAYSTHDQLWDTLAQWARRADSPKEWRQRVLRVSAKDPSVCTSIQREQVVHVATTNSGAQEFVAECPPPEWLFIFDDKLGRIRESVGENEFGGTFGLDIANGRGPSEPPLGLADTSTLRPLLSPLEWRADDSPNPIPQKLGGNINCYRQQVPERITYMVQWIVGHLDAPTVMLWALKQEYLHDNLAEAIRSTLHEETSTSLQVRNLWNLILECHRDKRGESAHRRFESVCQRVSVEGWTSSVLRDFEVASAPTLKLASDRPIRSSLERLPLTRDHEYVTELVKFDIEFPSKLNVDFEVPDYALVNVFRIMNSHLHRISGMGLDIEVTTTDVPDCYQDPRNDIIKPNARVNDAFLWFTELFGRLANSFPSMARSYVAEWSLDNPIYFRKLILFAMNYKRVADDGKVALFDASDVEDALLELPSSIFWDFNLRRELLFLLSGRWHELSINGRLKLVDRILAGPDCELDQTEPHVWWQKERVTVWYLKWLLNHGCSISKGQQRRLDKLVEKLLDWHEDEYHALPALTAVFEEWHRLMGTTCDLNEVPTSEVVELAITNAKDKGMALHSNLPFAGLIQKNLQKAINALTLAHERGEFPQNLWSQLIKEWPVGSDEVSLPLFLEAVSQLSHAQVLTLGPSLASWFESRFARSLIANENLAWKTLDHVLTSLQLPVQDELEESVVNKDGEIVTNNGAHLTLKSAVSDPIGQLTTSVIRALREVDIESTKDTLDMYLEKLERLLDWQGMERNKVVAVISKQLIWLYSVAPEWTLDVLCPLFDLNCSSAQAAWVGVQDYDERQRAILNNALKRHLLQLFPSINQCEWDAKVLINAAEWIVSLIDISKQNWSSDEVSAVRRCLRNMEPPIRNQLIPYLGRRTQQCDDGWKSYFIPFVRYVWPKESACRSSDSSLMWVSVLGKSGDKFPIAFDAVRHLLCPIVRGRYLLDICEMAHGSKNAVPLARQFPKEVLDLVSVIVPDSPNNVPCDLKIALDIIGSSDQELTQDHRWIKLSKLWDRR